MTARADLRAARPEHIAALLTWLDSATPAQIAAGLRWYDDAKRLAEELAALARIDVRQACAVIAATSINTSWQGNVTLSRKAAQQHRRGRKRVHVGLSATDTYCRAALAGDPLPFQTAKLRNFALAIAGDDQAVVVDRWMYRAVGETDSQSPAKYDRVANAVRVAAAQRCLTPRECQAVVWVVVRDAADATNNRQAVA